jgi:ABC-type oligopeptide transport system substrate-binding subunit
MVARGGRLLRGMQRGAMLPDFVKVLLTAALLTFAAACGRCGLQPDAGVKVVVPAMPTTLDWSTSDPTSWVNYPVMLATQRGLTELSADHTPGPGLATRWERETLPDGRERYVFHLRRDVLWSDGKTKLTAKDFVVGWRRAVMGRERGDLADLDGARRVMELLAKDAPAAEVEAALEQLGVRALDEHTLEVVLARPRSYFLSRLANVYLFFPAPAAALEGLDEDARRAYFDRPSGGHPLALGPWQVESWDRAGERMRLRRNPHTSFPPPSPPGTVQPERVTLMRSEIGSALYRRGRVQFVFIDNAVALQQERPDDLQRQPLLSTYFLGFNAQRPPLDRPEVRRALAMAMDRPALLAGILPASRPTRTLLPPDLPGAATAEEEARLLDHDPQAARAILQGEVTRPLRLVYRAGESFIPEVALVERLRAQLAKVGVKVELDARYDFSAELARRGPDGLRTWDLYVRRLGADYAHPNTFFTLFNATGNHHTGWETMDGGASVRRFEALLAQADAEPDMATAQPLYAQAQAVLLREEAVIVPLYHPDRYYRMAPELLGLDVDPFNFLSLRNLVVRAKEPTPR